MADTTFEVLDAAAATVTFRAQSINATTIMMQTVPSNPSGTAMLGQTVMASALPVAIASNQSIIPVSLGGGTAILAGGTALVTLAGGTALVTNAGGTVALAGGTALVTLAGGTALVTGAGGTVSVNIASVGGVAFAFGQAVMATSIPVAIASNQSAIPVTGSFTAGTTPSTILTVISTAATPAPVAIKATSGTLLGVSLYCNHTSLPRFLKIYNLATGAVASNVVPNFTIGVPPGATRDVVLGGDGASFTTAMSYLITGLIASDDTTAVAINDLVGAITYV